MKSLNERISVNSNIYFGKPCDAEMRITVQNVLETINEGLSFDEIKQDYYLNLHTEDVRVCLDEELFQMR